MQAPVMAMVRVTGGRSPIFSRRDNVSRGEMVVGFMSDFSLPGISPAVTATDLWKICPLNREHWGDSLHCSKITRFSSTSCARWGGSSHFVAKTGRKRGEVDDQGKEYRRYSGKIETAGGEKCPKYYRWNDLSSPGTNRRYGSSLRIGSPAATVPPRITLAKIPSFGMTQSPAW